MEQQFLFSAIYCVFFINKICFVDGYVDAAVYRCRACWIMDDENIICSKIRMKTLYLLFKTCARSVTSIDLNVSGLYALSNVFRFSWAGSNGSTHPVRCGIFNKINRSGTTNVLWQPTVKNRWNRLKIPCLSMQAFIRAAEFILRGKKRKRVNEIFGVVGCQAWPSSVQCTLILDYGGFCQGGQPRGVTPTVQNRWSAVGEGRLWNEYCRSSNFLLLTRYPPTSVSFSPLHLFMTQPNHRPEPHRCPRHAYQSSMRVHLPPELRAVDLCATCKLGLGPSQSDRVCAPNPVPGSARKSITIFYRWLNTSIPWLVASPRHTNTPSRCTKKQVLVSKRR